MAGHDAAPAQTSGYDYFNLDPISLTDPWGYWDWVRAQGPVYRDPATGVHVVASYKGAVSVITNTRDFSSCVAATGHTVKFPGPLQGEGDAIRALLAEWRLTNSDWMLAFLSYDAPEHTRFRKLVAPLFTPNRLEHLRAFSQREVDALIDEIAPLGRCKFGLEFASRLPLLTMSEMFDVSNEFRGVFAERQKRFLEDFERGETGHVGTPDEDIAVIIDKFFGELSDQLATMMEARRRQPSHDVLSQLINGRFPDTGAAPTVAELLPVVKQVFAAGIETTALLMESGVKMVATNPSLAKELRDDPGLMDGFVDELLRTNGSSKVAFRLALRDVELDGMVIPARSIVCISLQGASMDPARFPLPRNFDIRRGNVRDHLSFGGGIHSCIGQHVARMNMRVVFTTLLRRLTDIRLAKGAARGGPIPSFLLHGPEEIEIEYSAV